MISELRGWDSEPCDSREKEFGARPADRAEAIRVLRRAVELGINFIDTADSYGPGVSEEIIAEALHPYPANLVIATKGGFERPGPDRWVENGTARASEIRLRRKPASVTTGAESICINCIESIRKSRPKINSAP